MKYKTLKSEFDKALEAGDKERLNELHDDIEEFWFSLCRRSENETIFRDEMTEASTLYEESCHYQVTKP